MMELRFWYAIIHEVGWGSLLLFVHRDLRNLEVPSKLKPGQRSDEQMNFLNDAMIDLREAVSCFCFNIHHFHL